MTAREKFGAWHQDCTIKNGSRTAVNWSGWCYHRTCYGSIKIPSNSNVVATWKIKIMMINTGYVCVGIDSTQQTDTWFYQNKQSPNYGYESTGKMYELGQVKETKQKYVSFLTRMRRLEMELNTGLGSLTFYKYNDSKKVFQHSFKIKIGPQLIYRLAISIKCAEVTIVDFNMKSQKDLNHKDIKQENKETSIDDEKENNKSQSAEILSLKRENKTIQDNYNNILQQMEKYKQANLRQQTTILSLKKQIDESENKEQKNMTNINQEINQEMKKCKQIFNETAITKIYKENPKDILDENSWLHKDIQRYENNIGNMMESLNSFKQYIKNRKLMMNNLSSPNQNEYKQWNIEMMIMWIGSIENGRFIKYLTVLRNGFVISDITRGEYLPDLDIATLSVEPFNITSFPDKRDLVKKFKQLEAIEGVDSGTVYH